MRNMRLEKREMKNTGLIKELLEECQVLRIGAVDEEGMFIVPVNYGYLWDTEKSVPRFYIHSAKEGRKAEAFQADSRISFELDFCQGVIKGSYACSYSCAFRSIMGTGHIRLVTDRAEKEMGLKLLMKHMAPNADCSFSRDMLARVQVYCIETDAFTGKERKAQKTQEAEL